LVEPVALTALAMDAAVGWPRWLYARAGHPVGLFARVIAGCEARWNRRDWSDGARRAGGIATVVMLVGLAAGASLVLAKLAGLWECGPSWIVLALLAWPALAQRSLDAHFVAVFEKLRAGELDAARHALGMIVGRDTLTLDEAGVARAGIESLAESFCDGVIAPLFWLLVAGLPGLWAMKAVNTADSLIGHREAPFRDFGWAAARLDDAMIFVPARLSALLICLAGGGGWRICWRHAGRHASPNAGWPEAAMAGVLGIRLAGPVSYDGIVAGKPWIGEGGEASVEAMAQARRVFHRACLLGWVIAGGTAWLA